MNTLSNLIKQTIDDGEEALAHDDLERAESLFRSTLKLVPDHPIAQRALGEIARMRGSPMLRVIDGSRTEPLSFEKTIQLAVPLSRLLADDVPAREAFVLARLVGGPRRVQELVYACEPPPGTVVEILERALEKSLISITP